MTVEDSCPGVLRLHQAADGQLARVRIPGGQLSPQQCQTLAEVARDLGDGNISLTARGNVQVRQIRDGRALTERLTAVGLVPSRTHDRVRNILASPLSGRRGGKAAVSELVTALDATVQNTPELALLSGRVLFGIDDGRGDITCLEPDFGVHALGEDSFGLVLAGTDSGVRIGGAQVVPTLVAAAREFLEFRRGNLDEKKIWRLCDIPSAAADIPHRLALPRTEDRIELPPRPHPPIGWLPQDNGLIALGAGCRFGTLPARVAEFLAAIERPLLLTPWRSLLVTDLTENQADQVVRVLAPMGLIFDAQSPWLRVTACIGLPGCAHALADVRTDATRAIAAGQVTARQHWSGCARRCGRPAAEHTDITATPNGYQNHGDCSFSDTAWFRGET